MGSTEPPCEPQLSCSVEPGKHDPCHGAQTCSCGRQLLMPALQACCKHAACDVRSCSKRTLHNVKNSSVDDRATGFTKSAKWHDCDRTALLLWHMPIAKNAPMLRWYAASKTRGAARHQREPASPAADPAVDSTRAAAQDIINSRLA